ncbi:MAG: hypothetical protein R3330_14755 [Saprospiraceae bacterium]|nr:hypothetical protein [Saprospiraceae bacterium]
MSNPVEANDDIRIFDWRLKYNVLPADMTNFQTWMFDATKALAEAVGDRACLRGLRVLPLSGLTVRVEEGIGVNELGEILVVKGNSDVAVASPVGNPARSLVVLRPLKTGTTSTTDPVTGSPFNLHTIQGAQVVVINGTPAPSPSFPAIDPGDVVLMGFELTAAHATIVQGDFKPGQRHQASNIRKRVALESTDVTLTDDDDIVEMDASGAARTVNLPPASECLGKEFTIIKTDSSSNTVTVDPDGSETINGIATVGLLAQWQRITIYSNGAAWRQK